MNAAEIYSSFKCFEAFDTLINELIANKLIVLFCNILTNFKYNIVSLERKEAI